MAQSQGINPFILIADIRGSVELTESFLVEQKSNCLNGDEERGDEHAALSVLALAANVWTTVRPEVHPAFTEELRAISGRFQRFYRGKYPARRLTWIWSLATSEIETTYLDRTYILLTSACQANVLLQFNEAPYLNFYRLLSTTQMEMKLLAEALDALIRVGLLVSTHGSSEGLTYHLNQGKCAVWQLSTSRMDG